MDIASQITRRHRKVILLKISAINYDEHCQHQITLHEVVSCEAEGTQWSKAMYVR